MRGSWSPGAGSVRPANAFLRQPELLIGPHDFFGCRRAVTPVAVVLAERHALALDGGCGAAISATGFPEPLGTCCMASGQRADVMTVDFAGIPAERAHLSCTCFRH